MVSASPTPANANRSACCIVGSFIGDVLGLDPHWHFSFGFALHVAQQLGCNHVAIEVSDIGRPVAFYQNVFGLQRFDKGEGEVVFRVRDHHFGIMVRDEAQLAEVHTTLTGKNGMPLIEGFRCDFRDPWGNRIQVVDIHDESLVWLLPYGEVQQAGVKLGDRAAFVSPIR